MRMILLFGNGQSMFVAPVPVKPALTEQQAWDNLDREIQAAYDERAVQLRIEVESRVQAFIERTGIPAQDVVLLRCPSGVFEPHWRGVLPPQVMFPAGPCPDCGEQH
jgi:hypothetical protein